MPKDNDFPDLEDSLYFTAEEIYGSEDNSLINDASCLIADPAPAVSDVIPENPNLLNALANAKQEQQRLLRVIQDGDQLWSTQEGFATLTTTHLFRAGHIDKATLEQQINDAYLPLRLWFSTSILASPITIEKDSENLENTLAQTLQINEELIKRVSDYNIGLNLYKQCTGLLLARLMSINPATAYMNIISFPPITSAEDTGSEKENRKKIKLN